MAQIDNKYKQEFQKITQGWERLVKQPNSAHLSALLKDVQHFQQELRNISL